jgi:hypothetical protein
VESISSSSELSCIDSWSSDGLLSTDSFRHREKMELERAGAGFLARMLCAELVLVSVCQCTC